MGCMAERFAPIAEETLRDLAGPAAFGRGLTYHRQGRVELLSAGVTRAVASVRGTETYRVELRLQDASVAGTCECPAFEDSGFCKHMVAVALAAAETGALDRVAPLRDYLSGQGIEALVERLLRLAERDDGLMRDLEREVADLADSDEALVARYRKMIDEATDPRGGVDYWGAGAYADEIATLLPALNALARSGRAAAALELVEHLLDCIEEGIGEADDSEGEVYEVGAQACRLHLELCRAVRPDARALGEALFTRQVDGEMDLFAGAAETYADVLGPDGLATFHRLAAAAWAALPPPRRDTFCPRRSRLKAILDDAAQQAGDVDARIGLRKAELTEPGAYREIAELCVAAGREEEALRWIEEGLWCFEDRPDDRLQRRAAELMVRAGRAAEAQSLLWRVFERHPSLAVFRELAAIPTTESPVAKATAMLREAAQRAAKAGARLNAPAQILLDLQLELGAVDDAWVTAQTWGVGEHRLMALAERTIESHGALAAAAYQSAAESRIAAGGSQAYDEAVALVRRRGLACNDAADQAAYVDDLRTRHKAKRTFIQRLQVLN
jgi:uncharacterized protein DUF6880/SWIM zinc finger